MTFRLPIKPELILSLICLQILSAITPFFLMLRSNYQKSVKLVDTPSLTLMIISQVILIAISGLFVHLQRRLPPTSPLKKIYKWIQPIVLGSGIFTLISYPPAYTVYNYGWPLWVDRILLDNERQPSFLNALIWLMMFIILPIVNLVLLSIFLSIICRLYFFKE